MPISVHLEGDRGRDNVILMTLNATCNKWNFLTSLHFSLLSPQLVMTIRWKNFSLILWGTYVSQSSFPSSLATELEFALVYSALRDSGLQRPQIYEAGGVLCIFKLRKPRLKEIEWKGIVSTLLHPLSGNYYCLLR